MFVSENTLRRMASRAGLSTTEYRERLNRGLRYCWRCQDWHPCSDFGKDASRWDGLRRSCRRSINAASRQSNLVDDRPLGRTWKPVVGYEGLYDVSDCGDVWSRPRNGKSGRLLKAQTMRGGYLAVGLCAGGRQQTLFVHVLVMGAFVGPCPAGLQTRHLDGDPTNNVWPANLTYGTAVENAADKVVHGTVLAGERHPRHKLTRVDVQAIHEAWRGGESKRSLARRFGVTPPMIRRILAGTAWSDEFAKAVSA